MSVSLTIKQNHEDESLRKLLEHDELLANALKLDEEHQHLIQVNTFFIIDTVLLTIEYLVLFRAANTVAD